MHNAVPDGAPTRAVGIIPDKPNRVRFAPAALADQVQRAKETLRSLCLTSFEDRTPEQVHALPITTNQEYGFDHTPLAKPEGLFSHPKGTCDVTRYADTYYAMTGRSPFAPAAPPAVKQ